MATKNKPHFTPNPFKPALWAFNTHIHTIYPSLFPKNYNLQPRHYTIDTPDGDFLELDLHIPPESNIIVAMFHGLEGSSDRYYIRSLMTYLGTLGVASAAMNFRGCGDKLNRKRRFYHSGETQDYHTFISWLTHNYTDHKIHAVGFSLGANALVKYLSEHRKNSKILRAVCVSPPYDLMKGSLQLHRGFNRVYELSFLQTLIDKLRRKKQQYPDLPSFNGNSLYEFDDQVTAPVHGFKNAKHYYDLCSSRNFYASVQTPLLIIHSKKDTLCPLEYAPFGDIDQNPHIETIFTEQGGHVGFISSPEGWLDKTIADWLVRDGE